MDGDGALFVPLPYCTKGCVVCEKVDSGVTLMTPALRDVTVRQLRELSEKRDVMARQLQVLAEDIRRMETRLADDKPLFVHQDCLKSSKLSLPTALPGLKSNRQV